MTEITSDEEFEHIGEYPPLQNVESAPTHADHNHEKNIRVQITPGETTNELNLLESQYYFVTVLKNNVQDKQPIKRRFSDFDMLFEMLFRENKGKIFPAFPEKGIVSYVKSKIAMTKDDKFVKERIQMVERFLTKLYNSNFDGNKNKSMMKFFSDKEFEVLKKQEIEKSQGVIVSSWGKMINYLTSSSQNKYQLFQEQIIEGKKKFEFIYTNVKSIRILMEEEQEEYRRLKETKVGDKDLAEAVPELGKYLNNATAVKNSQDNNLAEIRELEFESFCENEDYLMVIKMLESMEEMKKSEQNYNDADYADKVFQVELKHFKQKKDETEKTLKSKFNEILNKVKSTDANNWCRPEAKSQ